MMGRKRSKGKSEKVKVAGIKIERMPLVEIVPADYNPRTIDESALAGLSRSVEEFGYVEPLVFNTRSGRLVSGHQRLKVLVRQGVEEADVVVVDLDDARERALNVAMNNEAIQGEWDSAALRDILDGLKEHEISEGLFDDLRMDVLLTEVGEMPNELKESNDIQIPEQYNVLVLCKDEQVQKKLLQRLTDEGLECRALIS